MLPVSVLPVAGILLGVGSAKFAWLPETVSNVMAQAGGGVLGEVPMVGGPIRLDGERADAPLPPPALGEHGDLLREWADDAGLQRLRAAGIVG